MNRLFRLIRSLFRKEERYHKPPRKKVNRRSQPNFTNDSFLQHPPESQKPNLEPYKPGKPEVIHSAAQPEWQNGWNVQTNLSERSPDLSGEIENQKPADSFIWDEEPDHLPDLPVPESCSAPDQINFVLIEEENQIDLAPRETDHQKTAASEQTAEFDDEKQFPLRPIFKIIGIVNFILIESEKDETEPELKTLENSGEEPDKEPSESSEQTVVQFFLAADPRSYEWNFGRVNFITEFKPVARSSRKSYRHAVKEQSIVRFPLQSASISSFSGKVNFVLLTLENEAEKEETDSDQFSVSRRKKKKQAYRNAEFPPRLLVQITGLVNFILIEDESVDIGETPATRQAADEKEPAAPLQTIIQFALAVDHRMYGWNFGRVNFLTETGEAVHPSPKVARKKKEEQSVIRFPLHPVHVIAGLVNFILVEDERNAENQTEDLPLRKQKDFKKQYRTERPEPEFIPAQYPPRLFNRITGVVNFIAVILPPEKRTRSHKKAEVPAQTVIRYPLQQATIGALIPGIVNFVLLEYELPDSAKSKHLQKPSWQSEEDNSEYSPIVYPLTVRYLWTVEAENEIPEQEFSETNIEESKQNSEMLAEPQKSEADEGPTLETDSSQKTAVQENLEDNEQEANPESQSESSNVNFWDSIIDSLNELANQKNRNENESQKGSSPDRRNRSDSKNRQRSSGPQTYVIENVKRQEIAESNIDLHDLQKARPLIEEKLMANHLLGIHLLQALNEPELEKMIFAKGDDCLFYTAAAGDNAPAPSNRTYIALAVSLYAVKNYESGNFYRRLEKCFPLCCGLFSPNKTAQIIRECANHYLNAYGDAVNTGRQVDFYNRHAIVPAHNLPEFTDLIFQIYVSVLKNELPPNLDEILLAFYQNLRKHINEGRYDLPIYTMIKAMKQLIHNECWHPDLVAYTKVLLLWIDRIFWEKDTSDLPYQNYLGEMFKRWKPVHLAQIRSVKRTVEARRSWKPIFYWSNGRIMVRTPEIIYQDSFLPGKVEVLLSNNGQRIQSYVHLEIRSKEGLVVIQPATVHLNNPFQTLRVQIVCGETVLFDSEGGYYRDLLLFRKEGSSHEVYLGDSVPSSLVCFYQPGAKTENVTVIRSGTDYITGLIDLDQNVYACIGNRLIEKGDSETEVSLEGKIIPFYTIEHGNQIYPVYSAVDGISFDLDEADMGQVYLRIEDRNIHPYIEVFTKQTGRYRGRLGLTDQYRLKPGFSEISMMRKGENRQIWKKRIFYDPAFEIKVEPYNNRLSVAARTDLFPNTDEDDFEEADFEPYWDGELDFNSQELLRVEFSHPRFEGSLYTRPPIHEPLYRLDDQEWRPLTRPLFGDDIRPYSKLYFSDFSFDRIVSAFRNRELNKFTIHTDDRFRFIRLDELRVHSEMPTVELCFGDGKKNGIGILQILYKTRLIKEPEAIINMDGSGLVRLTLQGPHACRVQIRTPDNILLADEEDVIGTVDVPVKQAFKGMAVRLEITVGDSDDLFSETEPYTVKKGKVIFDRYNLENMKECRIRRCQFSLLAEDYVDIDKKANYLLQVSREKKGKTKNGDVYEALLDLETSGLGCFSVRIENFNRTRQPSLIRLHSDEERFVWDQTSRCLSTERECRRKEHKYKVVDRFYINW